MIAVPRVENEMRTIAFTTEGIDILGPDGTPLRPRKGGAALTASITKDQFLSTEAGQTLVELWQAVLRNKGMTIPSPICIATVREWGNIKGIDRIRARTRTERPVQKRPPDCLDAIYLLNEFILVRFPGGGVWCTASTAHYPSSTGDTEAFLDFLKRPEYVGHPYTDTWSSDLSPAKPRSDPLVLIPNLKVLRETNHQRIQKWIPLLKKPIWFLEIRIGPPITAKNMKLLKPERRSANHLAPQGSSNSAAYMWVSDLRKPQKRPREASEDETGFISKKV